MPAAIRTMMEGKTFTCKGPDNIWDYIYVKDATEATVKLLKSDFCGVINVASGRPIAMREVFQTIAHVLQCEDLLILEEGNCKNLVLCADAERMRQVLGFRCRYDFLTGITETIDWWKNQNLE